MCYFQSRQSNGSSASGRTVKAQVSSMSEPLPQVNSTPPFVPTPAVPETASIPSTNLSPPSSSFAHSPPPGIPPHCADMPPRVKRPYCDDDNDIKVRYRILAYGIYIPTVLPVKIINTLMNQTKYQSYSKTFYFFEAY